MKKLIPLLLCVCLLFSLAAPASAATAAEENAAQLLYDLGLFKGVNATGAPNFELDRTPTRAEALVILVRLLGAEKEALSSHYTSPFTDVPAWAKDYVGYAYQKNLTQGISATSFAPGSNTSVAQFLTFLLRALGYKDGVDFRWNTPWTLTDKLGISSGQYPSSKPFLRADAAFLSAAALRVQQKGSAQTMLERLLEAGAITGKNVVFWDNEPVSFLEDFASFLFFPVKGSPATFTNFHFDKVTVNGLACETLQVNTPAAVSAYLAAIGHNAGGFGYVEISYDQAAAEKAAPGYFTDSDGMKYPLLDFTFTYTGTRSDGSKVTGTFTDRYYMDWE